MAWYNIKSSKIIAPVKLVLPGIAVSLIGGGLGVLIFNNPAKTKGKATQEAWHSVIQYEKIYDENLITTTRFGDFETLEGLKKYKNDVMHQIQMLSENYKNVKEEKNIDNRLLAVINCKVDTYKQILTITDLYMDSVVKLVENSTAYVPSQNEADSDYALKVQARSFDIMGEYSRQRLHLIARDSSTIKNILQQLTASYTTMLYKYKFSSRLPGEFKSTFNKLHGEWEFIFSEGGFTFGKNNEGTLTFDDGFDWKGSWSLDKEYNFVITKSTEDSIFSFKVLNVTDHNIRLAINDSLEIIGFRKNF